MKKLSLLFIVLLLLAQPANASYVHIVKGNMFVNINHPTWMNSASLSLGATSKNIGLSYTPLWSEKLYSSGYRLSLEYKYKLDKINLITSISGDRYPRVNWGGITFTGGVEYNNVRVGIKQGWLTDGIEPYIALVINL